MAELVVRVAVPRDVVRLRDLIDHLVKETWAAQGSRFPAVDDEVLMPFILDTVMNHWCSVIEMEGHLVGSVALCRSRFFWADAGFLADAWFYVLPKFRKTRAALTLMEAAKAQARIQDVPLVMGINTGHDLERKERWYSRQGLTPIGTFYTMGLEP